MLHKTARTHARAHMRYIYIHIVLFKHVTCIEGYASTRCRIGAVSSLGHAGVAYLSKAACASVINWPTCIHACVCVCMYVYIYIYIYIYIMYVYRHVFGYVLLRISKTASVCTIDCPTCVHTNVHLLHKHTQTNTRIQRGRRVHKHTHTTRHACTQTRAYKEACMYLLRVALAYCHDSFLR